MCCLYKYFYDFVVFTLLLRNNVRYSFYGIDTVKTYRFTSDSMDCLKMVVWSLNTKQDDLKWEGIVLCGCCDCISDYTLFTVIAQSRISDLLHDVLIGMQIIRYLSVPHN